MRRHGHIEPPRLCAAGDECSVHLFDGDNFQDDDIVVRGEGRYPNLANLPGADQDWTREAHSFRLGRAATLTIWPETDYGGSSRRYPSGGEEPDLDGEIGSMEITCGSTGNRASLRTSDGMAR